MVVKKEIKDNSIYFENTKGEKTPKMPIYLYILQEVYLYTHKSQLFIMTKTGEVA